MSSTLAPSSTFKCLAALLVLGAGIAVGCSAEDAGAELTMRAGPERGDESNAPTPEAFLGDEDASTGTKSIYRGNPLCRVEAKTCMPDDDGTRKTVGVEHCGQRTALEPEAGSVTYDLTEGCRVTKANGDVAPSCQAETGTGGDGASCETGADCAVGFDCIVGTLSGDKVKTCRHYCCVGSCKTQTTQNGGPTFCDVQRLAEFAVNVPVCIPLKRCKPLTANQCSASETCAIVSESGDFGCVTVGDRQVGESCDEDHCAADLTCIGQPGGRKCAQLCDPTKSTSCGSNQKCETSPIFKDANVGICKEP